MRATRYRFPMSLVAKAVVAVLATAVLVGCGSRSSGSDGTKAIGTYTFSYWRTAEPGPDGNQVVLVFDGPDPSAPRCWKEPHASVFSGVGSVEVDLRTYAPVASSGCPLTEQRLTITLDEPLGNRVLVSRDPERAMKLVDGAFQVIPESTACGRVDCSTPSPTPAACTLEAAGSRDYQNVAIPDGACDGSFLIGTIDDHLRGCPATGGVEQPRCQRPAYAYYVAREGTWRAVSWNRDDSCDAVAARTGIRFPEAVCASAINPGPAPLR
jgi:hypothetical protein